MWNYIFLITILKHIKLPVLTVAARGYLPPGANVCVAAPPHPVAYLEI